MTETRSYQLPSRLKGGELSHWETTAFNVRRDRW